MTGRIGYERNGITMLVTHIPERKKPCLCLLIDNEEFFVGTFASEGRADFFLSVMEEFFGEKLQ